MFPGQFCYSIGLYKPPIIVSVQGYLMLIDRVHLVLLNLKQHLLPVYCFTIKQAFSDHTFFYTFAALLLHFLSIFLYEYIFALKATNSVMIFPPSSSFIRPITFLFFLMGSDLFSSFEYPLVSNHFSTSFRMSCKLVMSLYLRSLSHKQNY